MKTEFEGSVPVVPTKVNIISDLQVTEDRKFEARPFQTCGTLWTTLMTMQPPE